MSYQSSTENYLQWLESIIPIEHGLLDTKNKKMADSAFSCLRGTFYRWARHWQKLTLPSETPAVLGIGDLHIENFGTWRDSEGRLAWGVNDFDEVCELPYLSDLARLATSANLAFQDSNAKGTPLSIELICEAICSGYCQGMRAPRGFILGENHQWMLDIARNRLRPESNLSKDKNTRPQESAFEEFVRKMTALKAPHIPLPPDAEQILTDALPRNVNISRIGGRVAGLGSLGRQRYTGVVDDWNGGIVVREVKRLAPSAWLWATGQEHSRDIYYQRIVDRAQRSLIRPSVLSVIGLCAVSAADADKIQMNPLAPALNQRLLEAMGHETANLHWASVPDVETHCAHLDLHGRSWLTNAVKLMTAYTERDHEAVVRLRKKLFAAN